MTPARAAAARRAEVRQAARAWRASGAIDDATLERIEAAYPDDRHRMATAWKVLIFVVTTIAANALFFGLISVLKLGEGAGVWFFFGLILSAATELLLHGSRIGDNGSAAATSFWAVVYAVAGCALQFEGSTKMVTVALAAAAVLFLLACWRWGFAIYGGIAAVAFFLLLARVPYGRWVWIVVGGLAAAGTSRMRWSRSLAPPFRSAAAHVFAVSLLAVYAAVNRFSVDRSIVQMLGDRPASEHEPALQLAATLATAVLPLLLIVWGVRRRDVLLLDLGLVFGALSLVTLRYYVHLAPLWLLLSAAGGALVLGALWVGRRLREAPNGEWRGFTARPLDGRRAHGLEAAAIVAAFAPAAPQRPEPEPGGFTPGGGRFGGGGATGSF